VGDRLSEVATRYFAGRGRLIGRGRRRRHWRRRCTKRRGYRYHRAPKLRCRGKHGLGRDQDGLELGLLGGVGLEDEEQLRIGRQGRPVVADKLKEGFRDGDLGTGNLCLTMKSMKHMKETGRMCTQTQLDVLTTLFLRSLHVLHGENED